jgi:peptide deformylase
MALLGVLQYPDERLRTIAKPVSTVDSSIKAIVSDMFETMYEQQGVGLAATQVNVHQRIIVIDVSEDRKQPLCLINPEITAKEGVQYEFEGCLSFPGVFDKVERAAKIHLKALDQDGNPFELDAEEILAICIQHELDHLNGVLFVDHLSSLKRERARKKLEKMRRREY